MRAVANNVAFQRTTQRAAGRGNYCADVPTAKITAAGEAPSGKHERQLLEKSPSSVNSFGALEIPPTYGKMMRVPSSSMVVGAPKE